MSDKSQTSGNLGSRIRSSLVIKLNLGMLKRLISAFFAINALIIIFSLFIIVWKSEEGSKAIIDILKSSPGIYETAHVSEKYTITIEDKLSKGFKLPDNIQNNLPINIKETRRSIRLPKDKKDKTFKEIIYDAKYIIQFSLDESFYQISYPIGLDFKLFMRLFIYLLILELLILIGSIRKGSRTIRRTLQPIAELAQTAQNLNAGVSAGGDGAMLKDLTGVISNIDANKLDSYISVDSSQDELKDLAYAINNMLERINASYQSQVRFVSDASHELRTPISVIQGYANLLDRWGKNDEKTLQESIDAIKSETDNMKSLVEQLLFLARGDNETMQLHKDVFDSCEIMDEIIRETHIINDNYNIETNLDRPAFINGDRQLLKQAIRILVDNSIKYTPDGDKIILKIIKDSGNINIIVQDNGIGIDTKDLPNIFDRFYRSDESRARKTGGSGLGLSIAKWIIERHGAYFEILSRVDIGTRITIVFPEENMIKEGDSSAEATTDSND